MSSVASTSASTASKLVVNGLVSGITTPAVINALLESYEKPITDLQSQQSTLKNDASDLQKLATALSAVQTAAGALNTSTGWHLATASSSDPAVATAVAGETAQTGSLSFTVTRLAQANVLASSGSVVSPNEVVTTASSLLVATGLAALGFSEIGTGTSGGATLPLGAFTMTVTQSSSSGSIMGSPIASAGQVAATATLTLTISTGGTTKTYTLRLGGGTYAALSTLAAEITTAARTAGAPIQVSAEATGRLELATDGQGATASLTVTGGSARTALGLTAGQSGRGSDAVVTVGGITNTVAGIAAGGTVKLTGPGGATISATVSTSAGPSGSLLTAGSGRVANVSTGNRSLSDVVAAINSAGLEATASAVQLESGHYILQLSADGTGTAGAVSVDDAAFSGSALGQLRTITEAQDATVSVGGAGGYTLSSPTDTFTDLLAGTTVTVASTGAASVTVTHDATGEASRVAALVTAANKALSGIQTLAGYTTASKTGGPLMGNAVIAGIKDDVLGIFSSASGSSTLGDASNAGITLSKTGTLSFTRQAFTAAFAKNPTAVADLFVQGGSYTPTGAANASDVAFGYASTTTAAGSYVVKVTQSATQAVDQGRVLASGAVSTAETLSVRMGTATATYTTTAGETLATIASGLNTAFASAKLALSAAVVHATTGERIEISSADYGTAASFTVTSVPAGTGSGTGATGLGTATPATFSGLNVEGTITGVAANGSGQVLSVPSGSPGAGLGLVVTAAGITPTSGPVTLGSFAYRPGIAQQLVTAMNAATNAATGSVTSAVKSLTTQATGLNSQITMYEHLEAEQRTTLQKEFDTMETNLGKLKDESSELTSELSKLKSTSLT